MGSNPNDLIRLFLCGDVMTGRGIDQILPRPGNPSMHELQVRDARQYVRLAETAHGPIPRPVDFAYPWGGNQNRPVGCGPFAHSSIG
jgi:poly-gamma-glutamate synthesis protein (capsule biosynthesis protein)